MMYELTTPQQNIWNLQKYYEGTSISNICGVVFFNRKMDTTLLSATINQMIAAQAGFRLQFCEENGAPMQYVTEYSPYKVPVRHFETMGDFKKYANERAKKPIGLLHTRMFEFTIVEVEGQTGFLLCASHLISDAWTFSLVVKDALKYYNLLEQGEPVNTEEISYIDYVEAEKKYLFSENYKKDKAYWEEQYADKPDPSVIKTCAKAAALPVAERFSKTLSKEQSRAIDEFTKNSGISQAVLFEAAMTAYLKRINGDNRNITLGIPVLNRRNHREKMTAGMYISTMPMTISVSDADSIETLCNQITQAHYQLFRHQKFPYSHILEHIRKTDASAAERNLYDVFVSFQNATTDADAWTEWFSNGCSEVPFSLHIDHRDAIDKYTLTADYQIEVFHSETEVSMLVERLLLIVQQMIQNMKILVGALQIIPDAEYHLMIQTFNDTAAEYPRDKCVQELFEEQAKRKPEQVAVVATDRTLSFRALDMEANQVANLLMSRGMKRGDIVAVMLPRQSYTISAILGVLKAGCAYMPIAVDYPTERVLYMLKDCGASSIVTTAELAEHYQEQLTTLVVPRDLTDVPADKPDVKSQLSDLFVVLHTSGSTGKPKTTGLLHRGMLNYRYGTDYLFAGIRQTISTAIITFDAFILESVLTLSHGITMVFLDENQMTNEAEFERTVEQYEHSFIFQIPTKLMNYIRNSKDGTFIQHIDTYAIGGENFIFELYNIINAHGKKIYHVYGPTETSLWVTNKTLGKNICDIDEVTLGKPIANTQIYILDKDRQPLPIGVAGELCISGDGVGKGYLNQPVLTAQKFVSNPFIPGTTMYCTGDLARWRADGEIEYLGRMDNQVKVRGLRIELGEIESVMNTFEHIRTSAVKDQRDEQNRQYLVGYYVADGAVEERALRQYLSGKLPRYMVPNFFVQMEEMSMTPSGKTDRKNLPLPDFNRRTQDYIQPETAPEEQLCAVLCSLFSVEQVGVTDDFFELGGDSLKAIAYVAKAHNQGIQFTLQNVFDYPTVRQLLTFLASGDKKQTSYSAERFVKYRTLLESNGCMREQTLWKRPLGDILLTGATGFLGAHILDSFIKQEMGVAYCLVRDGAERLKKTLEYYFGDIYTKLLGQRIIPVKGDITRADLTDEPLPAVQTVIHTAASVKHFGAYDYFYGVNVEGTKNVIAHAKKCGAKLIHISTLSVSGNSLADEFEVYRSEDEKQFDEASLYIGQPLENVYVRSKFEGECAVLDAALEGLDAVIVRVGNLTSRYADYKFQPNYQSNAFLTRVKAALELGMFPDYLLPLYAEFSPIDLTADGVIKIAQYAQDYTVFHLNSNRPIYFDRLLEVLKELHIQMKAVDGDTFNSTLQEIAKHTNTEYIYEAFQNDMDEKGRLVYDSNIRIKNDFTVEFLRRVGFTWKEIDLEYIRGYVEYFRKIGYLNV